MIDEVLINGCRNREVLEDMVEMLKDNVNIELLGTLEDYVGVHIENKDGVMTLTQPTLIDSILEDLRLDETSKTHSTPAMSTAVLHADEEGEEHDY